MVSEHAENVGVITCDGRIACVLDLLACRVQLCPCLRNLCHARLVKNGLVVEKCKYIWLVRNGFKGSVPNLTARAHQTRACGCLVVVLLYQVFQVQDICAPCLVHSVDILVKHINVGSCIQRRLKTLADTGTSLKLNVNCDSRIGRKLVNRFLDHLSLRLCGLPHGPVYKASSVSGRRLCVSCCAVTCRCRRCLRCRRCRCRFCRFGAASACGQ